MDRFQNQGSVDFTLSLLAPPPFKIICDSSDIDASTIGCATHQALSSTHSAWKSIPTMHSSGHVHCQSYSARSLSSGRLPYCGPTLELYNLGDHTRYMEQSIAMLTKDL